MYAINPVLPIYVRYLGFSIADLGIISASIGITLIIFEPLWGFWLNSVGAKRMFLLSVLLSALIAFAYTLVRDLAGFILLRFLSGVAASANGVSTRTLLSQAIPKAERSSGIWYAIFAAAGLIGPAVGGYTANASYNLAFYVAAAIAGLAFFLSFGIPKFENTESTSKEAAVNGMNGIEKRALYITSTLIVLPIFLRYTYQAFMPVFAKEKFLLSPFEIGLAFAVMGAVGFFAPLLLSELSGRIGTKRIILVGMILLASSFLLLPLITGIEMLCLTAAILGLGNAAVCSPMMSILTSKIRFSNRGFAIGVYGAGEDIGILIGPLVTGYVYENYSAELSFQLIAGLMLVNAAISIPLLRKLLP
jgi:MFS family permease